MPVSTRHAPGFVRRGLKVTHLRLFAALAETGQMSAAAAALAITQPAASRLAAEAERIAGARLYERTGRGVELNAAGQAFARRARRMLFEIADTERELAEMGSGQTGTVRVGSVTGPSVEHVLPAVRQMRLSLPRVEVNIEVATSDVLGEGLIQGNLDFYLGRLPAGRDRRLFETRFVGAEPISIVGRAGHPLLRATPERMRERLAEFDWVLPFEGTLLRTTIEAALLQRGLPLPAKILATSSFMLTVITVSRTNAIAPISTAVARFFATEFGQAIAELPTGLGLEVEPYALIRMAGREPTPAARAIYEAVLAETMRERARAGEG